MHPDEGRGEDQPGEVRVGDDPKPRAAQEGHPDKAAYLGTSAAKDEQDRRPDDEQGRGQHHEREVLHHVHREAVHGRGADGADGDQECERGSREEGRRAPLGPGLGRVLSVHPAGRDDIGDGGPTEDDDQWEIVQECHVDSEHRMRMRIRSPDTADQLTHLRRVYQ